jgi:type IV pilus assembly protein PilO
MARSNEALSGLRNRTMMLILGGAALVLLIWYVGYFSPAGKHLAAINTQTQGAQTEQAQLNEQLAKLKTYSHETGKLMQLSDRLAAALPPTTDIYNYITALSNAGASAGVSIQSVSPNIPSVASGVSVIPVDLTVKGNYDQTLAFIKALYNLPRLTFITSVEISGGGGTTNRSTSLTDSLELDILATPTSSTSSSG